MPRIKVAISVFVLCSLIGRVYTQSDPGVYSARAFGMGGIGVTLQDIDAVYTNPAGLTSLEFTSLHAGSAQGFGLSVLTQANAAAALKTSRHDVLFARAGQFGFDAYQERQVGVGYAMQFTDQFSGALRFDVYQFSIEGYGNAMLPGFLLGIQYSLGETLTFGAVVRNPIEIATHDEVTLPTVLSTGLSYHPSEQIGVFVEIEKDIDFEPRLKLGIEYQVVEALSLRVGTSSNPGTFHAGIGLRIREKLRIDVAAGYHAQLGFTPAIGIAFSAS